jgi:4-aminobutyrate aminotransferase
MWAMEHNSTEPDIVTSAKSHRSTYGGSPVPCAAGLATLEVVMSENLLENSTNLGDYLLVRLRKLQANEPDTVRRPRRRPVQRRRVSDGRVANAVQNRCFEKGLLVLEAGENVIRMSPSLVLRADEAETGLRLFSEGVSEIAAGR